MPSSAEDLDRYVAENCGRFRRILVAGGDGTLNRVINAVPQTSDVEIALLPLGTGNDFSRSLGLAELTPDEVGSAALDGPARACDVIDCSLDGDVPYRFINVANGGFGGRIATFVNSEAKNTVGPAAYWLASAGALRDLESHTVALQVDGGTRQVVELIGLVVANGRYVGGGFEIAPDASIDDGSLDVVLIPNLSSLEVLSAGVRYVIDGDAESTPATVLQARALEIESSPPMPFSIDGELSLIHRARFEIVPEAVRVVRTD